MSRLGSCSRAASSLRLAVDSSSKTEMKHVRIINGDSNTVKPFSRIPTVDASYLFEAKEQDSEYRALFSRHGPVIKHKDKDGTWTVLAHGPQEAAAVYRAEGRCPSQGRLLTETMEQLHKEHRCPPSMAFANGEDWRRIRQTARRQATPKWAEQFVTPLCTTASELTDQLRTLGGVDGRIEDIRSAINQWAYQGTMLFVLGETLNMYRNIDHTHQAFMTAGSKFIHSLKTLLALHSANKDSFDKHREFNTAIKETRRLGKQLINRSHQQQTEDTVNPKGLYKHWVKEGLFTREESAILCSDMLATSYEATASTATFLIFELAKQPLLQDKLVREIHTSIKEDGSLKSNALQKMKLLRHCVKETLRLYPPIALSKRGVVMDTVVNGYQVLAGTNVHVTMGLMSHDQRYFNQPMRFKPERWSGKSDVVPFSCLPFGFGARACFGRRLAETQLHSLLAVLIPKYRLTTHKEVLCVQRTSGLVPIENVPLTVTARKCD